MVGLLGKEMLLQDNQDIALTGEEKQRLVQSDLQPGQVKQNQIHQFHFSEQKLLTNNRQVSTLA